MNDMTVVHPDDLDAPFEDRVIAALRALIAQGDWSCDSDSMCSYRGAGGNKCLVGMLIPDNLYDPKFEGASVDCIPPHLWNLNGPDGRREALLLKLQKTSHDSLVGTPFNAKNVIEGAIFACGQTGYAALAERIRAEL